MPTPLKPRGLPEGTWLEGSTLITSWLEHVIGCEASASRLLRATLAMTTSLDPEALVTGALPA